MAEVARDSGIASHVRTQLEKDLAAAPGLLARIQLRAMVMRELGELQLNVNDELTGDVDVLTPAVNNLIDAYQTVRQINVDLQAQVASGADRSLSVAQASALTTRLSDLQTKMENALKPAVVTPTPDQPVSPSPAARIT